jgi:hypothetical protein
VELEVGYGQVATSANIPGTAIVGKVGSLNVMANVLYDFMQASMITPYIAAGAGVAFVDSNAALGSTQFAYQAMLGLAANVNNSMRITVEGRYLGTTNPSVNVPGVGTVSSSDQNHPCSAGRAVQVWRAGGPTAAAATSCAAVVHGVLRLGPLEPEPAGAEHDQAGRGCVQVEGQRPHHRPAIPIRRARKPTTWRCRCVARTR